MKFNRCYFLLSMVFFLVWSQLQGQPAKEVVKVPKASSMEKASDGYQNFAFVDAIKTYERIAAKGYKSVDLFEKLANSYYFNAQLPEACKWYAAQIGRAHV